MKSVIEAIRQLQGPILITGAGGFVGANLLRMITEGREDVFGIIKGKDNWRVESLNGLRNGQVINADLTEPSIVKALLSRVKPRTVFDCMAYGAYSFEQDTQRIYQTNFVALTNLVEGLRGCDFTAYVHAGSSSEYGLVSSAPKEDELCRPNSDYSVSKIAASYYLNYMGKCRQFPCVNLRLYAVYGPLEDTSRLMPSMVRAALEGSYPPLVDPETSRDFVYVDDVCGAFILAAARMGPKLFGESLNIGTGKMTTIRKLAEEVRSKFAITAEPVFSSMPNRAWDVSDWYANPDKAHDLIGWSARTTLHQGLGYMASWITSMSETAIDRGTKRTAIVKKRSVSAIIACYRDGEAIPIMHSRLTEVFRKIDCDYEIIFVNDGSPDDSAGAIQLLSKMDSRVIGITHSRNFGSQMAFRSGMELATKDAVVLLDGDLQDPPELIFKMYQEWEKGVDVVYGRRIERDMPWLWGKLYKAFYRVFAAFSYVNIPLDAGDFSLIDRRAVEWILDCPERDLFMRGLRAYVGFRQAGVDYVRPERMFGRSTNNLMRNIEWAKRGIFSFSNVPLTMLTTLGISLLGLSIVMGVILVFLRFMFPGSAPPGYVSAMLVILGFGSLNLFALGLVGEYVAKILVEVKQRPRLIRSALIRNGSVTDLSLKNSEA